MTKNQLLQYRDMKLESIHLERRLRDIERMNRDCDREYILILKGVYQEKLQALLEAQLKIEKTIEALDPIERELMRARYIDGKEWVDIVGEVIPYEWTQTHRIHSRALAKIKDL